MNMTRRQFLQSCLALWGAGWLRQAPITVSPAPMTSPLPSPQFVFDGVNGLWFPAAWPAYPYILHLPLVAKG